MSFDDQTTGPPLDPREEQVHADNYVLNEIKRLLFDASTEFHDLTVVDRQNQFDLSSEYQISEQNDITTTGITHDATESEYRLRANNSTESIESVDVIRYVPGQVAEVGVAIRVPTTPTGDQEIRWGYWDGSDGIYYGWDSTGLFIESQRAGTRQGKVRQADWNGDVPDDLASKFADGMVTRLILTLYNYGHVLFEGFPRDSDGRINATNFHREAPTGETTLTEQNNPIRVEVDNPDTSDFDVFIADRQANIRGQFNPNRRVKGERRTSVSLSGTDWVPILTIRKKAAFVGIGVELFTLRAIADTDIIMQIRSDIGSSTDSDYATPQNVGAGETAVESNRSPNSTDLAISDGFFRHQTILEGGTGSQAALGAIEEVDLEEKRERPVTFFARKVSGTGGNIEAMTVNWVEQW